MTSDPKLGRSKQETSRWGVARGVGSPALAPSEGRAAGGCSDPASPPPPFPPQLEPDGLLVWVLAGALGLSLVCSLVSVPLQCFQLSRVYGFCLLLFYGSFLMVALLTEFGVIRLKSV